MSRPCVCDKVTGDVFSPDQCRACWLYRYSERHRTKWDAAPGLVGKAMNLAAAAGRFVAAGMPRTPTTEWEARLAVCRGCDRLDKDRGECRECGCPVADKAAWATEDCPLKRWPVPATRGAGACGGCRKPTPPR